MTAENRPENIKIGQIELALPIFFPSVSSVKTNLKPAEYAGVLSSVSALNRQFLVSAFDLSHASADEKIVLRQSLAKSLEAGNVVLLDSGNYESFWKSAKDKWQQARFHEVLQTFPFSIAFSFDEQNPPAKAEDHIGLIIERWQQDQAAAGSKPIIPIIHENPNILPSLCARVAESTGVNMIAVPERRLGEGIFNRANTVKEIRQALSATGRYIALHLLGTGNPISLAIYTLSGADSFDGLEWCQTVVDHDTALLFHSTQFDFFRGQTDWGDKNLSFVARTLTHNLEFYTDWMKRLSQAAHENKGIDFCRANFPRKIFTMSATALGWEQQT
ncbi:MAG: hypothetical protein EYC62_06460 [Alphaproteobacteria bacterium]|nr:MAG: hypothetical protein EYC62_06460 [Alphaproteobacteria bacterium]